MNQPTNRSPGIDGLFEILAATYGASWDRSLGQTPINDIKTVWASELDLYLKHSKRIHWALEHLPEFPPNVIAFKNLCRASPRPEVPLLPEPVADPQRVAQELAKLAPLKAAEHQHDGKAWARAILTRHKGGLKVNQTSLKMARDATGTNP